MQKSVFSYNGESFKYLLFYLFYFSLFLFIFPAFRNFPEKLLVPKRKKEEIFRLTEKKEETLRVEEQKAVSQVYQQLVNRVMDKVKSRLTSGLNSTDHASVINFQIVLLSKYSRTQLS